MSYYADEYGAHDGDGEYSDEDFDEIEEYEMLRWEQDNDYGCDLYSEYYESEYTPDESLDDSALEDDSQDYEDYPDSSQRAGKYVAIDCEFVGVGANGEKNALGRVSIVNWHGHCLYDTYVRTDEQVTDYRTWVSGVTNEDLVGAPGSEEVRNKVLEWFQGRIVIGHTIKSDLDVLRIDPGRVEVRDIAKWKPFRRQYGNPTPSLRKLAEGVINTTIQEPGQPHDSIVDARVTMAVYRTVHEDWKRKLKHHI